LVISAGYKYELAGNRYQYMDRFLYPRGYRIPENDRMLTFQSNYHFPLVYPDWGFWGIFYCTRVRANLFGDLGYATLPAAAGLPGHAIYSSVGAELILDSRWFNLADIPLGIRFSLLLTRDPEVPDQRTHIEVVIPIIRL
jgi:hypothetical protein